MKTKHFLTLAACCLTALAAQAQGKLGGVVQDSLTREPLAFASVFLANTTLGATTNERGEFEFARVPKGSYDLVGSYVGYRLGKQAIVAGPAPQRLSVLLVSDGPQLAEVLVQPPPNKPEEYEKFSKLLVGQSTFAAQCRLPSPEQVRVFYDDSTGVLTARAKQFVEVENLALGYRLKYHGLYFAHDAEDNSITYYGEPVFEPMTPADEAQRRLWAANRQAAYAGSFMHFLRSLHAGRIKPENYLCQQVALRPNPRFERADARRRALLAAHPDNKFAPAEQDSLSRWGALPPVLATLAPAARPLDSLRRVAPDGRVYLRFRGELQVAYFGEAPDPRYPRRMSALGPPPRGTVYPPKRQVSRLRLTDEEAEIQADGSLLDPLKVSLGEYWGFEKIGEFLPFDYQPAAGQ